MSVEAVKAPIAPVVVQAGDAEIRRLGLRLTLPAQLLLAFIVLFPLVMELYISFTDWTPLVGKNWVWAYRYWNDFDNYVEVLTNARLWGSIVRTFVVMTVCVPTELLLGLGIALLFTGDFFGKQFFYSILLMPMMVVPAVAGYMFFMLFQSGGPVNAILSALTGSQVAIAWLSHANLALAAVMIADIWQWTPLMFLILLAGLLGVPEDQLQMATLLGAGRWARLRHIVLPRISRILVIAVAIRTIEIFKIFDTLYIMTSGGPGDSTETISVYIYKVTMQDLEWSYVATIALFILVVLSAVAIPAIKRFGAAR
ncbi:MAG TPA: sugar ABC transporter permease [Roseiarcus sp.]|nr:sugar ABC transporter permease [Roseiarcus sp.]